MLPVAGAGDGATRVEPAPLLKLDAPQPEAADEIVERVPPAGDRGTR
jgi:hypothetical protein